MADARPRRRHSVGVSGANTLTIGIHFELICPWCFIGKRQLDLARERFARQFPGGPVASLWHPVQLLPDVPEQGLPFAEFYERRLGSAEAVQRRRQQIDSAARSIGLELDLTGIQRMPNTARAHRLLRQVAALGEPALYEALLDRLFAGYFQLGEDIGNGVTLSKLAAEAGMPPDRPGDATPDDAKPGAYAVQTGSAVPGVPHFLFNGRVSLSGAHDAAILFEAMSRAVQQSIAADRACA